jgi:hypothetical protein
MQFASLLHFARRFALTEVKVTSRVFLYTYCACWIVADGGHDTTSELSRSHFKCRSLDLI